MNQAQLDFEPSALERSPLWRIAWHAWPTALLIVGMAFVCLYRLTHPTGEGFSYAISAQQNFFDAPFLAIMVAGFAFLHTVANLAFLRFDHARPLRSRLIDASSILVSFGVILGCAAVFGFFFRFLP
jgi:uncharacterized membrane protein YbhN (UPF0104 family)